MQTLKEILDRQEERLNLRNVGFCVAVVLVLLAIIFGVAQLTFLFHGTPDGARTEGVDRALRPSR